jgi:metal-sulfur cluster biosynthetic enzyme
MVAPARQRGRCHEGLVNARSDPDRVRAEVLEAVRGVLDPCSVLNGCRLSLVDLGMVDGVAVDDDGRVTIDLLLDDPLCVYFYDIDTEIRRAIDGVPGATSVVIRPVGDRIWTTDLASPSARAVLSRGASPGPTAVGVAIGRRR